MAAAGPVAPGDSAPGAGWALGALLVVAVATALRIAWLVQAPIDIDGDEAQYWIWSRDLAFGYYSKPPLLAWLIRATTAVFGDGLAGVKLASPLAHGATALVLYALGRRIASPAVGFWTAVTWTTLPAVSLSALLISTDAPLLLCWAAALLAFHRALDGEGAAWWLAAGVATGLGLLAKYAMVYFPLSAVLYLAATPGRRALLWRRLPLLLATAGVLFLPNLLWNLENGLATFRHTGDNANLGGALFNPGALAAFVGAQFGVFGPLLFAALIATLVAGPRNPGRRLLAFFVWPTLVLVCAVAFLSRAHANWAAPAYVAATPLVVAWLAARGWHRIVAVSVALHATVAALVMAFPVATRAVGYELPARLDPWRRVNGWAELGDYVSALRLAHPEARLLVDHRRLYATLVYYVRPRPFDAVKWNPDGVAQDHFELTTRLEAGAPGPFLLVTSDPDPTMILARFERAERLAALQVPLGPGGERRHYAFLLRGFRGYR